VGLLEPRPVGFPIGRLEEVLRVREDEADVELRVGLADQEVLLAVLRVEVALALDEDAVR
jgi:hypothetical protein